MAMDEISAYQPTSGLRDQAATAAAAAL